MDENSQKERDYCYFLDHRKYNRNIGCRKHDNAYGINGGGNERARWQADMVLFRHMRAQGDPMAWITLAGTLCYGWIFFNYHPGTWLWRGQLIRRFMKASD